MQLSTQYVCTHFLSTSKFSFPVMLRLSFAFLCFRLHIVVMNGFDIEDKITGRIVFQSHFIRKVVESRTGCLVNMKMECR